LRAVANTVTLEAKNHGTKRPNNLCSYFVGVRSSKRNRVDIYPADSGMLYSLSIKEIEGVKDAQENEFDGLDFYQRRDILIGSFGSRKKKMMEKSRKANIVEYVTIAIFIEVCTTRNSFFNFFISAASQPLRLQKMFPPTYSKL
jgi:A49-like RNA polymerase I associated factor